LTKYEYKTIEWRNKEYEGIDDLIDSLVAEGWELEGPAHVYAQMFTTRYTQKLKRKICTGEDQRNDQHP